jgi:hypothetical protein
LHDCSKVRIHRDVGRVFPEREEEAMKNSPLPYLLWVLLPVGIGVLLSQQLATRETELQRQASTSRIGKLAARLLSEEMGIQAAELAREAPILTNPDPSSPMIQAAQRGDTLAGIGSSSGELTLSVALAEGSPDSLQLRGTTALFLPTTLDLVRSRTGFGIALYLRGNRAAGAPEDFGPDEMGTPASHSTSALFPLAASGSVASPAQLLVGPTQTPEAGWRPWRGWLTLLLAWGLGLLAWLVLPPRGKSDTGPNLRILILSGLPLLVLWLSLFRVGERVETEADELLRGDLVRVLALLKDGTIPLSPEDLAESTAFDLLRGHEGEMEASTLPPGSMVEELLALPPPPPTFPTLGIMEAEGEEVVYANLREGPGQTLTLVAASPGGALRNLRLILAGIGGGASLLSLGFLFGASRRGDH